MANVNDNKMIVGLDIGTSKVVAIVGAITPEGQLEIVGIGSHRSNGLKKGVVVNIESTVLSIQRAIEEAELMAAERQQQILLATDREQDHTQQQPDDGIGVCFRLQKAVPAGDGLSLPEAPDRQRRPGKNQQDAGNGERHHIGQGPAMAGVAGEHTVTDTRQQITDQQRKEQGADQAQAER